MLQILNKTVVFFSDESGPAAMQHGNSATNLKPLQVFQVTGRLLTELKYRVLSSFQFIYKQPSSTSVKISVYNISEIVKIIISSIRSIFILLLVLATQFLLFSTFQPYCILTTFALQQNLIYNQSISNSNKSENKKVTRWKRLQTYIMPMHLDDIYNSRNELLSIEQKGYKKSNKR